MYSLLLDVTMAAHSVVGKQRTEVKSNTERAVYLTLLICDLRMRSVMVVDNCHKFEGYIL